MISGLNVKGTFSARNSCLIAPQTYRSVTSPTFSIKSSVFCFKTSAKVVINVSGTIFETCASTLNRYPETLLGSAQKRSQLCKPHQPIYFDRDRASFEAILFYYQSTGCLARPQNIPMDHFVEECRYFELPEKAIETVKKCNGYIYSKPKDDVQLLCGIHSKLWDFLEDPWMNVASFAYFSFYYFMIILAISTFCVESEIDNFFDEKEGQSIKNSICLTEFAISLFFAFDITIRFCVCPWPRLFVAKPLNVIEIIAIFGHLVMFIMPPYPLRQLLINTTRTVGILRLVRVHRLSKSVKVACAVFTDSYKDIVVVAFTILVICIFCGSIMYYIESRIPRTKFDSIPQSMWWALETVVCLGYGDIVPTSTAGKVVGSPILFLGVVSVTVLLLSLGGRFFSEYSKELTNKDFLPSGGF